MVWTKRFVAAAGLATVVGAAAHAADWPGQYPPPLPPPKVVEYSPWGWYLRGDLGYRIGLLTAPQSAPGFSDPTDNKLGDGIVAGVGVGIRSQWLRTDLTIDYGTPQKYTGTVLTSGDTTAKIQASTILINGYVDVGTWAGITPYFGAGLGAANVRVSEFSSTAVPPFSGDTTNSRWNFAYAGMAGIGWTVSHNLVLDFGYRYIYFGNVATKPDAFGAMTFRNLAAHELRVGLRWSFDDIPFHK